MRKERTFFFIKPDAIQRNLCSNIYHRLLENNIAIVHSDTVVVSRSNICEHYKHIILKFGSWAQQAFIDYYCGKKILIYILECPNAINLTRKIVGYCDPSTAEKGTIRGDFGIDSMEEALKQHRICNNLVHASDSEESADYESMLWLKKGVYEF